MAYHSLKEIVDYCDKRNVSFFQAVLDDDMEERKVTREESMAQMYAMWDAMLLASTTYDGKLKSASGLTGGQGAAMEEYRKTGKTLCGDFISQVVVQALQMGESNACMKRIVAAPTAGSCGVLPAVLIPYFRMYQEDAEDIHRAMIESLYVAAGIGQVIAARAFIAGAAGGCQAEIGAASSMAAGALTALKGGDNQQICHASAIAMKSLLGLVCDPVAGLVEVPCVKRNVTGAVNALTAADMALAGITSAIPADQVFDAMREVGEKMHLSLKETGEGGLAATPEGIRITKSLIQ
ncbi:MAG: L-serine ammonia-lyase, iron-sulfur-dependent, subunit alpha [Hungatella sp.]|nr:L-serine ammonia-lyase, iron-sulfur-dependent, subunit alpha [Hungatella sp.]